MSFSNSHALILRSPRSGRLEGWAAALRDDVGQQPALESRDLVLERKLALLQPLQLKLVERLRLLNACDDVVEVAVLAFELRELVLDRRQIRIIHRRERLDSWVKAARSIAESARDFMNADCPGAEIL
jgi:hypothetical protein